MRMLAVLFTLIKWEEMLSLQITICFSHMHFVNANFIAFHISDLIGIWLYLTQLITRPFFGLKRVKIKKILKKKMLCSALGSYSIFLNSVSEFENTDLIIFTHTHVCTISYWRFYLNIDNKINSKNFVLTKCKHDWGCYTWFQHSGSAHLCPLPCYGCYPPCFCPALLCHWCFCLCGLSPPYVQLKLE